MQHKVQNRKYAHTKITPDKPRTDQPVTGSGICMLFLITQTPNRLTNLWYLVSTVMSRFKNRS